MFGESDNSSVMSACAKAEPVYSIDHLLAAPPPSMEQQSGGASVCAASAHGGALLTVSAGCCQACASEHLADAGAAQCDGGICSPCAAMAALLSESDAPDTVWPRPSTTDWQHLRKMHDGLQRTIGFVGVSLLAAAWASRQAAGGTDIGSESSRSGMAVAAQAAFAPALSPHPKVRPAAGLDGSPSLMQSPSPPSHLHHAANYASAASSFQSFQSPSASRSQRQVPSPSSRLSPGHGRLTHATGASSSSAVLSPALARDPDEATTFFD